MVSAIPSCSRPAPDGGRIAANVLVVAIHTTLLLVLLVPLSPPDLRISRPEQVTEFRWILPKAPPPLAPVARPVVPQRTQARSPTASLQPRVDALHNPLLLEPLPGDLTADPSGPAESAQTQEASLVPVLPPSRAALQTLSAPPPPYPGKAVRERLTGTVVLEILVDVDGLPMEVRVVESSGHRELDRAARRVVLARWRFVPATVDGHAVQALGRVPIEFKLEQ